MDNTTQAFFKNLLIKRLDELYSQDEKRAARLSATEENFPDLTDRAAVEWDRNFMVSVWERERKLISEIREALQRIDEGDFGECGECGDYIGIERLKASPIASLCIGCKRKQESAERARVGAVSEVRGKIF